MKIALFINYLFPEKGGGASRYVRDIARELVRAGHHVEIFCATKKRADSGSRTEEGSLVHRVYLARGDLGPLRLNNRIRFSRSFKARLHEFDILNIHGVGYLPVRELRKYRDRVLFTCHASLKKEVLYDVGRNLKALVTRPWQLVRELLKYLVADCLERQVLKNAFRMIVMSNYVKGYMQGLYPFIDDETAVVVPIGIGPDRFKERIDKLSLREKYNVPATAPVFFTARRFVPRMGLPNLIEAAKMVMDSCVGTPPVFLLAGTGPLHGAVVDLIRVNGLEDQCRLLGFVTDVELADYYALADCFILPTEELEGFGIVALEALVNNLPVIGTPAGAIPEILSRFQPDLISESTAPEHLAEKIRHYMVHMHGTKLDNRLRVLELYGWDAVLELYRGIFDLFPEQK